MATYMLKKMIFLLCQNSALHKNTLSSMTRLLFGRIFHFPPENIPTVLSNNSLFQNQKNGKSVN
jgi:hypothetical protein